MKKVKSVGLLILLLTLVCASLTGCGSKKKQELATYKASMETFCKNIAIIDGQINALDPSSDSSKTELLKDLDTLNDQFSQMANLTVPENFAGVEELADQASENMSNAVTYYHQAYDGDTFNQNYADAAAEYYRRANVRLKYILELLHGADIKTVASEAAAAASSSVAAQSQAATESAPAETGAAETGAAGSTAVQETPAG